MQSEDCPKGGNRMKNESRPYVDEEEDYDDKHYAKENIYQLTLEELIKKWDTSYEHGADGDILDAKAYWNITTEIRNRLNIVQVTEINRALDDILKLITKVDARLRNHRHDKNKSYSGKAEF